MDTKDNKDILLTAEYGKALDRFVAVVKGIYHIPFE